MAISQPCRGHGVGDASIPVWKGEFGGTDISEAEHQRAPEDDNSRPKHVRADATLDDAALKGPPGKKG